MGRLGAFKHAVSGAVPGHAWAEPIERPDPPAAARPPDEVSRRAWFVFRGQRRTVNWLGPRGGDELLQALGDAFHIARRTSDHPSGKLIYLLDPRTREIVDIDSEISEEAVYEVQVEPREDGSGPLDLFGCLQRLVTFECESPLPPEVPRSDSIVCPKSSLLGTRMCPLLLLTMPAFARCVDGAKSPSCEGAAT